jgi:hypothetical protein
MRSFNDFRSSAARFVLATVLATSVGAPLYAAEVEPSDASGTGLDEIIVTAQKRSENLQDTPIAISVISGEALKERAAVSLLDLGDGAIPSLKVAPFFSRPGALIVNVRGVGVFWAIELVRDRDTREPLVPFNAAGADAKPMLELGAACKANGLWPFTHFNRLHIVPPLVISDDDMRQGLDIIDEALTVADNYYTGK